MHANIWSTVSAGIQLHSWLLGQQHCLVAVMIRGHRCGVHAQVVHADMKTKNILLSSGRMTAKIADVGLARFMAHTHMDTKSLPMGTFVYAAPELLLGKRSDHKVRSQPPRRCSPRG